MNSKKLKLSELSGGNWYSYQLPNVDHLSYLFISSKYDDASEVMGCRFLDPNWVEDSEPEIISRLGLNDMEFELVSDFSKFKKKMLKKGYLTYETELDCNYRIPIYSLIYKDRLKMYPEPVYIDLSGGTRIKRFLKEFDLDMGYFISYNTNGTLRKEYCDIEMIHLMRDTRDSKELVPDLFAYYKESYDFREQYIAYDPVKDVYINKSKIPEGEFISGVVDDRVDRFVLNKELGSFYYDWSSLSELWDYSPEEETNLILGYREYLEVSRSSKLLNKSVYDRNNLKFIDVTELVKGDDISFIDLKNKCVIKGKFESVFLTKILLNEGTSLDLDEVSNIIKLI